MIKYTIKFFTIFSLLTILNAKSIDNLKACNEEIRKNDFNASKIEKICIYPAKEFEAKHEYTVASWYYLLSGENYYKYNIDTLSHLITENENRSNIAHSYMLEGKFKEAEKNYSLFLKAYGEKLYSKDHLYLKDDFRILKRLYPDKLFNINRGVAIWNRLVEEYIKRYKKEHLIYTCLYSVGYRQIRHSISKELDSDQKIYDRCLDYLKNTDNYKQQFIFYTFFDIEPTERVLRSAEKYYSLKTKSKKELYRKMKDIINYIKIVSNSKSSIERVEYSIKYATLNYLFKHNSEYTKCIENYRKSITSDKLCNKLAKDEFKDYHYAVSFWMFHFANNKNRLKERILYSKADKVDLAVIADYISNSFNIDRNYLSHVMNEIKPITDRVVLKYSSILLKDKNELDRYIVERRTDIRLKDLKSYLDELNSESTQKMLKKLSMDLSSEPEVKKTVFYFINREIQIILTFKEEIEYYNRYLKSESCRDSINYLQKMLELEEQSKYRSINRLSTIEAYLLKEYKNCNNAELTGIGSEIKHNSIP